MSQQPTASQSHAPSAGHGVANIGCDGRIIPSGVYDLVHPSSNNAWWTVQYSSINKITTFLIFNRDDARWTYRTVKYYVTVGNGTSYSTNPKCVDLGSI